jgi:uncharacterized membrane protein
MRFPSIDLLRAVAIALMVTVHFVENLSGAWGEGVDFNRVGWLPAGFAAPLFTFLSGVSYAIWSDGLSRRGVSDGEISKRTVRRGLFLFGLGITFNVLVWLPEETFNWDILTFIGSSLLVLAACRTIPPAIGPLLALLAVAIAPVLRALAGYADFWRLGSYEPDLTLADVWLGFLCTGYFPLFPWLVFPIAGYAVAPAIFSTGHGGASLWPAAISASRRCGLVFGMGACLLVGGGLLILLPLPGPDGVVRRPWTMFPPTTAYVAVTLGLALTAVTLIHRWLDSPGQRPIGWPLAAAGLLSRYSLSIYLLHHALHIWPLWIAGTWQGGEPTAFWQRCLPPAASLGLAVVFVIACVPLFAGLERRGYRGIEGLMRWLCD